ncbi:hypothetical protein [Pelagicoccus mobilis]|uniref:Uncharacterized protein n=1 Tax=Pelagicoccus mobilis TaxID=415221 RepID=A0A934RYK4_9BACT|nr:hypothetical protein [Pelagicoccus mobilis]MBK1876219.1 hypothetical protein [Pelagicoccus mobilis]
MAVLLLGGLGLRADVNIPVVDKCMAALRRGELPTYTTQRVCHREFTKTFEMLCEKYGVDENRLFKEPDRTDFYLYAVKMSMIYPEEHDGWPLFSNLSYICSKVLEDRLKVREDLFSRYSLLFRALDGGRGGVAFDQVKRLWSEDRFLAVQAIRYLTVAYEDYFWVADCFAYREAYADALTVAEIVSSVDEVKGLHVKADVLAKAGRHAEAERCYMQLAKEKGQLYPIARYYRSHPEIVGLNGKSYGTLFENLYRNVNPRRAKQSAAVDTPPKEGLVVANSEPTLHQSRVFDSYIIVAVDGFEVGNLHDYAVVVAKDYQKETMVVTCWNGTEYVTKTVKASERRILGCDLFEYRAPKGRSA